MADVKITDLPQLTVADAGDLIPIVDSSANITKKVPASGVVPDGAVTTTKIADEAVTAAKINFTTLESETNMTNGGGVSGTVKARKHRAMVVLSGEVSGTIGSGNVQIGTLPAGYRPTERTAISTLFNGAIPGSGLVETSGAVYVTHTSSNRSSVTVGGVLYVG